ncbi:MAG: GyrI-like domain-containing protein [Thermoanaerobaculia bacterium]
MRVGRPRDSRSEYEDRMHRVIGHIDRHLDAPLDLETLAGVACFSPFHFHRLFTAWFGETPGDYLRRRRIESGALRLISQPRTRVLDVALAVGFGSAEAFTRAFRQRYGASPSAWRAAEVAVRDEKSKGGTDKSNSGQVGSKGGPAASGRIEKDGLSTQHRPETAMNVKLVDRQPVPIAYLRYVGPYGEGVSDFWQNTYYPWALENGLLDRVRYGISLDDPGVTADEKCRYDAAAEVAPEQVLSSHPQRSILPGGRYAALAFHGRGEEIVEAWEGLLRDWLPASGLQLDARPMFEHYPTTASYDPSTGRFECELCIPVAPL